MGLAPLAIAATSVVAAAAALLALRRHEGGGSRAFQLAVTAVSLAFGAAAMATVVLAFLLAWDHLPTVESAIALDAIRGVLTGAILYLGFRIAFLEGVNRSYHWARRIPCDTAPWPFTLRSTAINLVAWASIFAAMWICLARVESAWAIAVLPILVAFAIPLYESQVMPWIEYHRARTLGEAELDDLQAWLDEVSRQHSIPRFHVRIREGNLNNAFATGGVVGHLVVIGGGLLASMSPAQLKAILAHEVAHVLRRDAAWLLLAVLAGLTVFVPAFSGWIRPLLDAGGFGNYSLAALIAVPLIAVTFVAIPGFVSTRLELRADATAVALLGDWRDLASALARLAELDGVPLQKRSHTHPSTSTRIQRMQALG